MILEDFIIKKFYPTIQFAYIQQIPSKPADTPGKFKIFRYWDIMYNCIWHSPDYMGGQIYLKLDHFH